MVIDTGFEISACRRGINRVAKAQARFEGKFKKIEWQSVQVKVKTYSADTWNEFKTHLV